MPQNTRVQAQPTEAMPQNDGGSTQPTNFTKEELDQMLAPIALYPDSLLSQILMASTYPVQIVDADRWVKQHPNLTGDQLDQALQDKDWDPSVKSLCYYPTVLSAMSQDLDRTTALGDAFISQQQDVMNTVQDLRERAQAQGNLVTTPQQRVVVEQGNVEILPVNPAVVYVPAYNPAVVYGPWWYPAYPPYVWYPGIAVGVGISFGIGLFVGAAVASWSSFDWGHHYVNVDIHRTTVFNRVNVSNVNARTGFQRWEHNQRLGRFTTRTGSTMPTRSTTRRQFGSQFHGSQFHGSNKQSTSRSIQRGQNLKTQNLQHRQSSSRNVGISHGNAKGQHGNPVGHSHSGGGGHEGDGSHSKGDQKHK
jgi:Protein of unknown function (DUF3300)